MENSYVDNHLFGKSSSYSMRGVNALARFAQGEESDMLVSKVVRRAIVEIPYILAVLGALIESAVRKVVVLATPKPERAAVPSKLASDELVSEAADRLEKRQRSLTESTMATRAVVALIFLNVFGRHTYHAPALDKVDVAESVEPELFTGDESFGSPGKPPSYEDFDLSCFY